MQVRNVQAVHLLGGWGSEAKLVTD